MLLTPKFRVEQDEEYVIVTINIPYVRISDSELVVDGADFTLYCKPYLLKLTFPMELLGEEHSRAIYNPDEENGTVVCKLAKLHKCHYPGLDMLSRLLSARVEKDRDPTIPSVEVISSFPTDSDDPGNEVDTASEQLISSSGYGFNCKYSGVLTRLRAELHEVIELNDPERVPISERRTLRLRQEAEQFDGDRYLADLIEGTEDPLYDLMMNGATPPWAIQWERWVAHMKRSSEPPTESGTDNTTPFFDLFDGFNDTERDIMTRLPRREYLIADGSREEWSILMAVVDVLYAYAYDWRYFGYSDERYLAGTCSYRMTQGEHSVESSYTITRLSSTLSWFDVFAGPQAIQELIQSSTRRCLCYSYLRMWRVSQRIHADVTKILLLGRRCVLRCLLDVYSVFSHTETHYMLNKLYIEDMCVWIQGVRHNRFSELGKSYKQAKNILTKADVGLGIEQLERALNIHSEEDIEAKSDVRRLITVLSEVNLEDCNEGQGK